jgi:hypothetical protein
VNAQKWWWEEYEPRPCEWQHAGRIAWCVLNFARILSGQPVVPLPNMATPPPQTPPPPSTAIVDIPLTPTSAASLLGVTLDSSPDEVRAALRARMSAGSVHPDQGGDEEIAKQLIAARNLLIERARGRS